MKIRALTLAVALAISSVKVNAAVEMPLGVAQKLAGGEPQDLIVQFEEADIHSDAEAERARLGVVFDTPAMIERKAQRFAARKTSVLSALRTSNFEILHDYSHLPMMFVRFRSLDALNDFLHQPGVVAVYEDETVQAMQSVPWNLDIIGQPLVAANDMLGVGTTVAVIDSGVNYASPTFGACSAPGNPFDCKVVYFRDFCCSDGGLDPDGHGTNVAGIVTGVAPATRIAALRVLDANGNGPDSAVLSAVNWAISNKSFYNIAAMNLSLGVRNQKHTAPCVSSYQSPFTNARAAGILVAVAAGNDGFTDGISTPACTPGAVSVGATSWTDTVASFSNSASFLTMLAPGSGICTADSCMSGTSQATPHVAGAAAVLRAAYPAESVQQTTDRMTIYGKPITDSRNGITKPRLDLWQASRSLPGIVQFAPPITQSVGTTPQLIVAANLDGDSYPDLVVGNYGSNTITVFNNTGDRLSAPINTSVNHPNGMAVGDFNRDGKADIAVTSENNLISLLGDGDGTFPGRSATPVGNTAVGVKVLDIDRDGILDAVVANYGSNTVSVLLGNSNGTFQSQITYAAGNQPYQIVHGDFNRDGKIDLAVMNWNVAAVSVLLGNGNGTFGNAVNYPVHGGGIGIAVADLDGDGKLDLVAANYSNATISVLRGVGDGAFTGNEETYGVGTNPVDVAVADFNLDGFPDIVVTNRASNTFGVLLGNRIKTFQPMMSFATISGPYRLTVGDLDGNGLPDVALVGNLSNQAAVHLNITATLGTIFANGFER